MISSYMTTHYRHPSTLASLDQKAFQSFSYRFCYYLVAVFRYPYDMVLYVVFGMADALVFRHL